MTRNCDWRNKADLVYLGAPGEVFLLMRHCLITKLFPKGLGGKEGEAPKPVNICLQEGGQKTHFRKRDEDRENQKPSKNMNS